MKFYTLLAEILANTFLIKNTVTMESRLLYLYLLQVYFRTHQLTMFSSVTELKSSIRKKLSDEKKNKKEYFLAVPFLGWNLHLFRADVQIPQE